GYVASEGARFEVHVEKGRGLTGDAAKPFEAKLTADPDGKPIWTIHEIVDVQKARVEALVADGLSVRDIAEETDIPKSTVPRIKKAMERATNAQRRTTRASTTSAPKSVPLQETAWDSISS